HVALPGQPGEKQNCGDGQQQVVAGTSVVFHEGVEEGQDGQPQQQGTHRVEAADGAEDADIAAGDWVLHAAQQRAGEPQEREGEGQQAEGDVDQEGPAPAVLG